MIEPTKKNAKLPPVLVLYNQPRAASAEGGAFLEADAGVLDEGKGGMDALAKLGVPGRAVGVRTLREVAAVLAESPEPVVFNLVEALAGDLHDVNLVPAVCRALGKGATGSDTPALLLGLNKWQTKAVLQQAGIPTAAAVLVPVGEPVRPAALPAGRVIVKPAATDASEGIDDASLFDRPGPALFRAVRRIHREFGQPALIEQFVDGREINASIVQDGGRARVMPLAEIDFSAFPPDRPRILNYASKWLPDTFEYRHTPRVIPAPLPVRVAARVRATALAAWSAVGLRDYARVDFRVAEDGTPYVLEVNPNPDIDPEAGFAAAVKATMPYEEYVRIMIVNNIPAPAAKGRAPRRVRKEAGRIAIRASEPPDREAVLALVAATGFFRHEEVEVAREVLDDALAAGHEGHYRSFVALEDGVVAGWSCFGPTPGTRGTFDLYWIAVAPDRQGRGIGAALMADAEHRIRELDGRVVVVETSGRALYAPTRRFYETLGYAETARIADFYVPGDDKIVLVKRLE